jgi:hypothetical protein
MIGNFEIKTGVRNKGRFAHHGWVTYSMGAGAGSIAGGDSTRLFRTRRGAQKAADKLAADIRKRYSKRET